MAAERDERKAAAERYARIGWPVFPVCPGEKIPATKRGFLDATTDADRISYWWHRQPTANVGIATGVPGPDVVDVDVHAVNGYDAWVRLQREGLAARPAAVIRTPSGGLHAYFRGTEQRSGHIAAAGIDFRARGGYVVAPPSVVGGRPYVVTEHAASDATVDWPTIRSVLQPESVRQVQPTQERSTDPAERVLRLAAWLERQPEGNRNHGLFYAANRALEAGHADLGELAEVGRQIGLSEREIRATLDSARKTTQLPFERAADRDLEAC
jgi:hypothetical protein